ncbi:MAG TPA: DNA polymerase III subunit gamma/tau [Vicinamibacterales bacterium]|nr:DNA polymerase III subunit gamma/tau [Vicinamibacterales bacterium]
MSYQVLARKWRPQRFDDVIGQKGVTQTLRNAIAAKRIAQSFVFSGPRGVGKTTTARIMARALNCAQGPTADPCGACDACVEIADGRDMDVIEIDAATNTQVDKVRAVIIDGLGMAPVRNRYKIFIIDEVHRLSAQSFDALLKSIEEPPPHVVFMMATTEIDKVPPTIQSRSQVFELKTIGVKQIADQLRAIAAAERIDVDDAALMLIARAGDGSMRDAQSAFDQVIGFAGTTITADDVSGVLGLVRRDLLIAIADAVARDDAAAVFELTAQAVESGYDLRLVVRELARLTRDLLVLSIDASRVADPEIAAEAERQALLDLSRRFSGEDLMRAFDVLTRAEYEIRGAMQPRYQLEMALLRWIHLRKLVPLTDLIKQLEGGAPGARPAVPAAAPRPAASPAAAPRAPAAAAAPSRPAPPPAPVPASRTETVKAIEAKRSAAATPPAPEAPPALAPVDPSILKDAFLSEVRKAKKFFFGTVVAQAQRIEFTGDRVVFTFAPQHRALRAQLEQTRPWLEAAASQLAGRKIAVAAAEGLADAAPGAGARETIAPAAPTPAPPPNDADRARTLKERALSDPGVQTMLDVFAAEIKDVEEKEA